MANYLNPIAEDLKYFGQEVVFQLKNALKLVPTVRTDYDGPSVKAGSHVQIPRIRVAGTASTRVSGGAVNLSDIVSDFVDIQVVEVYKAVAVDNIQKTLTNVNLMDELVQRIVYPVGASCDGLVAGLWTQFPYEAGKTDGTAMFNSTDDMNVLNDGEKILRDNGCPMDDGQLNVALGTTETVNLKKLDSYKRYDASGDPVQRRTGELKPLMGFRIMSTQQIGSAQLSSATETASPGAFNGAALKGATSAPMNGLGTGAVKKGTTFTITGVTGGPNTTSLRFTVLADATITTNAATVTFFPPLPVDVADTTAVQFKEHTASAPSSMNLMYHRNAIVAVSRPLAPFAGNNVDSVVVQDPDSGLSLRISYQSQLVTSTGSVEQIKCDLLFGAGVIQEGCTVKLTGAP